MHLPVPRSREVAPPPPPEAHPALPRVNLDSAEAPTLVLPLRRSVTIATPALPFAPEPGPSTPEVPARTSEHGESLATQPKPTQRHAAAAPPPVIEDVQRAIPVIEEPPPISARDFTTALAPAARKAPAERQQRRRAVPESHPIVQRPAQRPSQQQAPDGADGLARPAPSEPAEPASDHGSRKAEQDYLLKVVHKISQHRFSTKSREQSERGVVVIRLSIARDGRLLDVSLVRSSGFANLDRGVMDTILNASPFAPLPDNFGEDRLTFVLPVSYRHER